MSFGWSAGDVAMAIRVLYKVGLALKEAGGASSEYQDTTSFLQTLTRTLEHLNALQNTQLDHEIATNLREQCDQIRTPLEGFLRDVGKYETSLGAQSRRKKILSVPRKLQWALSAAKEAKKLQDRIAVPMATVGIILGQQIVQNTLQMPADIQARVSQSLERVVDEELRPLAEKINGQMDLLSTSSTTQTENIMKAVERCHNIAREDREAQHMEIREANKALQQEIQTVAKSQVKSRRHVTTSLDLLEDHSSILKIKVDDISKQQYRSTNLIIRAVSSTEKAIRQCTIAEETRTSRLQQKLEQVDDSMQAIQGSLKVLSYVNQNTNLGISGNELEKALQGILGSIWLLLSSLQLLIREIFILLAPYLVSLYQSSMQVFMLHGERFWFEDAIGRITRLPCAEFQHWDTFYRFLINSFSNEPGLPFVLKDSFMITNGYNNFEIQKEAWQAVIQPRTRVKMAILLDSAMIQQGRCPDLSCEGLFPVASIQITQSCPICKKQFLRAEKRVTFNTNMIKTSKATDAIASDDSLSSGGESSADQPSTGDVRNDLIRMEPERDIGPVKAPKSSEVMTTFENDIATFKRVAWRPDSRKSDETTIFGCTFMDCDREFTSAPYWRIHENTHTHIDVWRCPRTFGSHDRCSYLASDVAQMKVHLHIIHGLMMENIIDEIIEINHFGPESNHYWCGFCKSSVPADRLPRLQHIEDHYTGAYTLRTRRDWNVLRTSELTKIYMKFGIDTLTGRKRRSSFS